MAARQGTSGEAAARARLPMPPQTPPIEESRRSGACTRERWVTVSMPYYRCRPYLRRAVDSVLAQSHAELTLVVVNDGDPDPPWAELEGIDDERLVTFDLPMNRGRYFADAVVLAACTTPYFATHDADDWSSPERLTLLFEALRQDHAVGAFSNVRECSPGRGSRALRFSVPEEPRPVLRLLAFHCGLFRADALRAVGGYYAGFRIGYDRFLVGLLHLVGGLIVLDEPLLTRLVRPDSLSNSAETGMASETRLRVRAELDDLYARAYAHYRQYVAGTLDLAGLRAQLAALVSASVPPGDAEALASHARRLREELGRRERGAGAGPPRSWVAPPRRPRRGVSRAAAGLTSGAPRISVVIPTRYDTEELPGTLESFLSGCADRTPVEFVVVDDGSASGVDAAALERRLRLRDRHASIQVLRPRQPIGIPGARNLGAEAARADRLFVTDAHVTVEHGWDVLLHEYGSPRRVLAATIVDDSTGARGYGGSLNLATMTFQWLTEPSGDPGSVPVAATSGLGVDRRTFAALGGLDPGMISYGSAEAEFSLRAWLRGSEVLNLPALRVHHRFRAARQRRETLLAQLPEILHNRLRFAVLYLGGAGVLRVLREMVQHYPSAAVAEACSLLASGDAWDRRAVLRANEVLDLTWFAHTFGLDVACAEGPARAMEG